LTTSPDADIARAEEAAGYALAAEPRSWWAHVAKAQVLRAQAWFEEAIPEYETVIELNHNAVYAFSSLGQCKPFMGSLDEVIPLQLQFIRLSPRDHLIGMVFFRIGTTHLLQSRIEDAIVWPEKARNASPKVPGFRALLASAYAIEGSAERAAVELAAARSLFPDNRLESIPWVRAAGLHAASGYFGVPKVRALFEATYFAGLRMAGCRRHESFPRPRLVAAACRASSPRMPINCVQPSEPRIGFRAPPKSGPRTRRATTLSAQPPTR
jgi:tetratricopeptide (TPR) repeat protein